MTKSNEGDEEDSTPLWQEMSTTEQMQALQLNVQKIGLANTLKKSITGELEIEDLLEP